MDISSLILILQFLIYKSIWFKWIWIRFKAKCKSLFNASLPALCVNVDNWVLFKGVILEIDILLNKEDRSMHERIPNNQLFSELWKNI